MTKISNQSSQSFSSLSQDSFNEGGSGDEAQTSQSQIQRKRLASEPDGTPQGNSESAKISGGGKKNSSQFNNQSEPKAGSRRSSDSNILASD